MTSPHRLTLATAYLLSGVAMLTAGPAAAQTTPLPGPPSLLPGITDDRSAADPTLTQKPIPPAQTPPPSTSLPPLPEPVAIETSRAADSPLPSGTSRRPASSGAGSAGSPGTGAVSILPAPTARPLSIDPAGDPVLAIARTAGDGGSFRRAVAAAVARNPALAETQAQREEVEAQRREARSGLFPVVDLNVTSYRVIDRAFQSDLNNIVERTRPSARTDAQLSVNQTLLDFGATSQRVAAAGARLRAAASGLDDTSSQLALQTIAAWYDVFSYRVLTTLSEAYRTAQSRRRKDLQQRIDLGASAAADISRLELNLAAIDTRVSRYQRLLANAEARFAQLTGAPAPAGLSRAPLLGELPADAEAARAAAADAPAVVTARALAEGARQESRAARSDTYPNLSAGVIAGRYGVFEQGPDYDIRGILTLRKRFFGGVDPRADQTRARANGAAARADRIGEEAARDAAIALADVQALDLQLAALRTSYIASRQSRDATEERFRVSRGSLFDVIDANDAYFAAAANYVETLADRDAAHYVLLARTGHLLAALDIESAYQQVRRP